MIKYTLSKHTARNFALASCLARDEMEETNKTEEREKMELITSYTSKRIISNATLTSSFIWNLKRLCCTWVCIKCIHNKCAIFIGGCYFRQYQSFRCNFFVLFAYICFWQNSVQILLLVWWFSVIWTMIIKDYILSSMIFGFCVFEMKGKKTNGTPSGECSDHFTAWK